MRAIKSSRAARASGWRVALTMSWENCFKTHNKLTMYLLGKLPFAPSVNWAQFPCSSVLCYYSRWWPVCDLFMTDWWRSTTSHFAGSVCLTDGDMTGQPYVLFINTTTFDTNQTRSLGSWTCLGGLHRGHFNTGGRWDWYNCPMCWVSDIKHRC